MDIKAGRMSAKPMTLTKPFTSCPKIIGVLEDGSDLHRIGHRGDVRLRWSQGARPRLRERKYWLVAKKEIKNGMGRQALRSTGFLSLWSQINNRFWLRGHSCGGSSSTLEANQQRFWLTSHSCAQCSSSFRLFSLQIGHSVSKHSRDIASLVIIVDHSPGSFDKTSAAPTLLGILYQFTLVST